MQLGFGSLQKFKHEETDGSCCGQKEHDVPFLLYGGIWPVSRGSALHFGHSVLGRRSLRMASSTKRSLGETDSRSSDVEAGKRTCRSSDVRDP